VFPRIGEGSRRTILPLRQYLCRDTRDMNDGSDRCKLTLFHKRRRVGNRPKLFLNINNNKIIIIIIIIIIVSVPNRLSRFLTNLVTKYDRTPAK